MKREEDIKFARCQTCPGMMSDSIPGKCWKCVLTGRAFMLPDALERYKVVDPTDDKVIEAQEARNEKFQRQEKAPRVAAAEVTTIVKVEVPKATNRFGQVKLVDGLLEKGLTLAQVIEEVKKQLPLYQGNISQLVKIRISTLKHKGSTPIPVKLVE